MTSTVEDDNKVQGIIFLTGEASKLLNPREEIAYKEHRRELAEWMLNLGKDPSKAEGYSYSTAKNRMNKLDLFYRWVWNEEQRFRDTVAPGRSEKVDEPEILKDPKDIVELSGEADLLLSDIVENRFKALTKRYNRFSSRYKVNKAKNELVEYGVVIERQVKAQDGKRKLLQLTDRGRKYIENQLDLEAEYEGRGGIIHRYWQHRIKEQLEEQEFEVFLETFDADVYVNLYDRELVVEVAIVDNPREIEHIEKYLDKDFHLRRCTKPGDTGRIEPEVAGERP